MLSGQTIAETAVACKLPVEVVRLYESLYFAVLDKLKCPIVIIDKAISPRFWSGYTADDVNIIIKSLAFEKGPVFLDFILPYFTTSWSIPDRLDLLSPADLITLHKMVSIRSLIEARTISPEKALVAYTLLAAGEPGTRWGALAAELQLLITARTNQAVEQERSIVAVTALSPSSIDRLMASYSAASSTPVSCDNHPNPVLLAS